MDSPPRRRAAPFVVPMLIGLIAAQRAAGHVRAVDFVLLLGAGMGIGAGLVGLIQGVRSRRQVSG